MDHFITDFGHRIDFVPGYFERNKGYLQFIEQKSARAFTGEKYAYDETNMPFHVPAKDLVNFSGMLAFLNAYGLISKRERGLDIGGAEGTCAALMRGTGLIKHSTSIDLIDFTGRIEPNYFNDFVKFVRRVEADTSAMGAHTREMILRTKNSFDHYPADPLMHGLCLKYPQSAQVDEYLNESIYDASGKYDFISSYNVFEVLELDRALAKVRELITDDGLFAIQDGYWWYPINSVAFLGHFPYACQRLSNADLLRYCEIHHPDLLNGLRTRLSAIYEGKMRPTVNDWFRLAEKNGLRPVAMERIVAKNHHRIKDNPSLTFSQPTFDHQAVLRDARYIQPDVMVDDLFTSGIRIAMVPQ